MSKKKVSQNAMAIPEEESTDICYTVSIQKLESKAFENLKALIKGKENIIKKALGVEELPIVEEDNKITFEWLPPNATQEEIHALMVLVTKIAELAKNLQRVNLKEKDVENEKYAFRCFLLRLKMNGPEYKKDRAILLSRLEGSSSFKDKKESSENVES